MLTLCTTTMGPYPASKYMLSPMSLYLYVESTVAEPCHFEAAPAPAPILSRLRSRLRLLLALPVLVSWDPLSPEVVVFIGTVPVLSTYFLPLKNLFFKLGPEPAPAPDQAKNSFLNLERVYR